MQKAILPSNKKDPTGAGRRVRGAQRDFAVRIRKAYIEISKLVKDIDFDIITVNSVESLLTVAMEVNQEDDYIFNQLVVNAALNGDAGYIRTAIENHCETIDYSCCELAVNESFYEYKLDQSILSNVNARIRSIIDGLFMVDKNGLEVNRVSANHLWFLSQYVEPSYEIATGQEQANLANQSVEYSLTRPNVESILFSEPYRRRIGLVAARQFELMEGFTDDVVKSTRNILSSGMAGGQSPTVIARSLNKMFNVNADEKGSYRGHMARSNRIARTEIVGAARTAHLYEALDAAKEFGFDSKMMHISALSPTTRPHHGRLHGVLRTHKEVREWYQISGQAINCLCSEVTVLLDDDGEPLNTRPLKQARVERKAMFGS